MSADSVVFSVEGNKVVPILLDYSALPRANPKCTSARVDVYTALALHQGRAGTYLVARRWRSTNSAPLGAIIRFEYSTGSWKNTYHRYVAFFLVTGNGETTATLHDEVRGVDAEVKVKNLVLLPALTKNDTSWAEAEILNSGWRPSQFDPVRTLYCYWLRDKVHERAVPQVHVAVATTPEEEVEPEEREVEQPLPVEEILAKPQELEVEFEQQPPAAATQPAAPSKPELVKIYLLSMRLPSKYLLQSVEYNASKTTVRELRIWAGEAARKAARLESIRREAYAKISRIFCFVEEYGTWVAVSDVALEEAKKVSAFVVEELKKLGLDHERYVVRAVPVYLAPEDARELLSAAMRSLSKDVEALVEKIKEAEREQNKRALKRLEKEKSYREALLAAFRSYLAQLG
jgi:hypothetical protein